MKEQKKTKEKTIDLDLVIRVIEDLKGPGGEQLSSEQCLSVLDTAKQILLYQKTMQGNTSLLKAMKVVADQCF